MIKLSGTLDVFGAYPEQEYSTLEQAQAAAHQYALDLIEQFYPRYLDQVVIMPPLCEGDQALIHWEQKVWDVADRPVETVAKQLYEIYGDRPCLMPIERMCQLIESSFRFEDISPCSAPS